MTPIFLGLGSNIEREQRLVAGLDALAEFVRDLRCSPVFESEPLASSIEVTVIRIMCTHLTMHSHPLERSQETPRHRIVVAIAPSADDRAP